MSLIQNTSDKKMLEIIVFGSSHPPNEFEFRKKLKGYIRKNGFGSTFLVEDFHFPNKVKKTGNKNIDISNKCLFFIESMDTGVWIFTLKGKGTGSHTELSYLLNVLTNKNPQFIKEYHLKNLFYGIFQEEKIIRKKIISGINPILKGQLLSKSSISKQFFIYPYENSDELKEMMIIFLQIVLDEYNEKNVDRLCFRFLPKPMCEIEQNNNLNEENIFDAEYLCNNDDCAKWICKKHLQSDSCPNCNNDMLTFDWEEISDNIFNLFH